MRFQPSIVFLLGLAATSIGKTCKNFTNPIIWEDLPDNEVSRVGDTFYMSASSFHLSPGAPVLRSYDLVNWEQIGHSVPSLDWGPQYSMQDNKTAYIRGLWASTLRYRESDGQWYFLACVGFSNTWIYTSPEAAGPWELHSKISNRCYYDAGLLFDDDESDSVYVAYGNKEIRVAQLSGNVTTQVDDRLVYTTPTAIGTLEGSRMYKKDGNYYILLTRPPSAQYILKSPTPWGPYEIRVIVDRIALTTVEGGGAPHQGSIVDTPDGQWYYMGFSDLYPGGRSPVLAPITWDDDGFPSVVEIDGEWGNYQYPLPRVAVPDTLGTDHFSGPELGHPWQWNHNPDVAGFSVNNGLTLKTVSATSDLYKARNTLTHRIRGPVGTGTVHLDFSDMQDGDRAGLSVFRDKSGTIGIEREGDRWSLVAGSADINEGFNATISNTEFTRRDGISFRQVYLRVEADVAPRGTKSASLSFSVDGVNFEQLGTQALNVDWKFFLGYRYGIYNYATKAVGGSVRVVSFTSS